MRKRTDPGSIPEPIDSIQVTTIMAGRHFYQVFRAPIVPGVPTLAAWTWQRIGHAGAPTARGALYGSLPECFAALKRNRIQLGDAPVRIDLAGASPRDASSVVAAAMGERYVTITSTDPGTGADPGAITDPGPSPEFA